MTLLLDLGNTRFKWGWYRGGAFQPGGAATYDDTLDDALASSLQLQAGERAFAVSVAAIERRAVLEDYLLSRFGVELEYLASTAEACGVRNGYLSPTRLGADRWAALLGARRVFGSVAICVVDCGSAVTVDAMDAQGCHQGGLIMPGLGLMRRGLAHGTAGLPMIDDAPVHLFGRDTASAIGSGTLLGLAAAIDGLAAEMRGSLEGNVHFILTGGDAPALLPHLRQPFVHRPNLVLEGLMAVEEARA